MNLEAKIELIEEKKLIGSRQALSISQYNVLPLWQGFGKRRKEIENIALYVRKDVASELVKIQGRLRSNRWFIESIPRNKGECG